MRGSAMDWDQIVRENASGMLRLAVRIVASSADAEELVQDAFLKAYQYQQSTEVVNWGGLLHRFVVNCALDHLRKKRATASLPGTGLASSAEDPRSWPRCGNWRITCVVKSPDCRINSPKSSASRALTGDRTKKLRMPWVSKGCGCHRIAQGP